MSPCAATSDIFASAPSRRCSPPGSIADQPCARGLMSTIAAGRITSSFIRSISVVPPASGWAVARVNGLLEAAAALSACTAMSGSVALWYENGRMGLAFHDLGCGLLHGGDDVGIGGTAADIAAHVLADVGIGAGMSD